LPERRDAPPRTGKKTVRENVCRIHSGPERKQGHSVKRGTVGKKSRGRWPNKKLNGSNLTEKRVILCFAMYPRLGRELKRKWVKKAGGKREKDSFEQYQEETTRRGFGEELNLARRQRQERDGSTRGK